MPRVTFYVLQHVLRRRRDEINMQCDALLAEIENKRSYFLADLEYEERIHQNSLEESIKRLEKVLGMSQGLQSYANDVMASDKAPFLEVTTAHDIYTCIHLLMLWFIEGNILVYSCT